MISLTVKAIKNVTARPFVEIYHYAHTFNACKKSYGLYENEKLVGCCAFGLPVGRNVVKSISPNLNNNQVLELKRLIIKEEIGKNAESYFISKVIKLLKKDMPVVKVIIAYSDPMFSHKRTIYQASSFLYQGDKTMIMPSYWHFINGKKIHQRSLIVKYGTIKEDVLKKLGLNYKKIKMLNKHRYIKLIGSHKDNKAILKTLKHPILQYPKYAGEVSGEIRLITNQERMVQSHHPALSQSTLGDFNDSKQQRTK